MNFKFFYTLIAVILCASVSSFAVDLNPSVTVETPVRLTDPIHLTSKGDCSFGLIQSEIVMLDNLIAATQISLDKQKALRDLVAQYNRTQMDTLADIENDELLFRAVKMAQRVLESIQENNLTHNFDSAFLSELTLLAQIGSKYGEPRP
jgi:hypothetical protein